MSDSIPVQNWRQIDSIFCVDPSSTFSNPPLNKFKEMEMEMEDLDMADVDPSLSLTAQGLWSDEESLHGQPTDEEDVDPASTTAQQPRRVPSP